MMDYSSRSVLVVDDGLFAEFATLLAKSFGKTYLFIPWASAYPASKRWIIGEGLEGVTKVESLHPTVNQVDLVCIPDIYFGALQEELVAQGKRVWGSRMGEELELFRVYGKQVMQELGLSVGPYKVLTGMENLRAYLKEHENQYVKISQTRGDCETFRAKTYALVEPRLDELEHRLGAVKAIKQFIVEEEIAPAVEVGYDGFSIDGQFPTQAMSGIEIKDKGYIGHFTKYADMVEQIRTMNAAVAPLLKEYHYRNAWSLEARITPDGTPWVIDPCARFGSPCSELQMLMYSNFPDIFWYGAEGEVVDPIAKAEWGAQVMLISAWANNNWQAIDFPASIREHVKLHFPVCIADRWYTAPQGIGAPPLIGAVVALGKTKEIAMAQVTKLAEQVQGYFVEIPTECFVEADKTLAELQKMKLAL